MISISVMASEERKQFFPYLKEKLGDVPFAIDTPRKDPKNIGVWRNCQRAWSMHDKSKDFHLVIQDDGILCENLLERIEDLIKKTPGDYAYSLYFGDELATTTEEKTKSEKEGFIIRKLLNSGVAIMLPTSKIKSIMEIADRNNTNIDDANIGSALQQLGMKVVYPVPCFIAHRSCKETPSLIHKGECERVTKYFIDK